MINFLKNKIKNIDFGFTQHHECLGCKFWGKRLNIPKDNASKPWVIAYGAGFTVIEVLISVAILAVILLISINLFASTVRTGKQVLDYQRLADELRNIILDIEKDINMGNGIVSNPDAPSGDTAKEGCDGASDICSILRLSDNNGQMVKYVLNNSTKRIEKIENPDSSPITTLLTSDNIEVEVLNFYVINTRMDSDPSNDTQPRATVNILAKVKGGNKFIKAQTTISEKNY